MLDVRKQEILRAVIHAYVQDAEPVGSERIAARLGMRVSPATIRNEMAVLETMGYLSHPHTSAGRVPTDRGYRCYVDTLLPEEHLTPGERARFRSLIAHRVDSGDIAEDVARALASVTEYASVVAPPAQARSAPRLHLVVVVKGTANILKQPEFQDARAAQPVLSALETDELLSDLLHAVRDREMWVTIGSEHRHESLRGTSVVAAAYRGEGTVGALGIVGPTRMKYARVISLVRYLAGSLSETLGKTS